jgi:hypothetical protein
MCSLVESLRLAVLLDAVFDDSAAAVVMESWPQICRSSTPV